MILITIFAINLWLQMSDVSISHNGKIAIFVGVFYYFIGFWFNVFSLFFTKNGFDDQVDHNLDSLLEKAENR